MKSFLATVSQVLFTLFMYAIGSLFFGAALIPGLALLLWVWPGALEQDILLGLFILGTTVAVSYFLFGISLILLIGLFRFVLRLRLKEGEYPLFSFEALKWAFISSLYLMVNFTFIDFILLTPFSNLLFRLLGAKLGKNVQFNSKYVFDATLLEIGDQSLVGGGAILLGHIVERGRLKLKKVCIGKKVTIGSHATIMPGCTIGDGATIAASAVLLKNTHVPAGETWIGIPAQSIRKAVLSNNS